MEQMIIWINMYIKLNNKNHILLLAVYISKLMFWQMITQLDQILVE